jgi:hypothetical protein
MKKVLLVLLAFVLVASVWLYWSPRAAARDIRNAAQAGDVEELQRLVDFPLVREQLKADLKTSLMQSADTSDSGAFGSVLATGLGGMMIDGVVNEAVSPSGIAALVRSGSLDTARAAPVTDSMTDVRMRYRDARTFVVTVRHRDRPLGDTVSFVLRRRGLAWRLVRVGIPNLPPR